MQRLVFLLFHLFAATLPIILSDSNEIDSQMAAVSFPSTFEGLTLIELPLTARENEFSIGFPGRIKRFTDGQREVLVRIVTRPTRKLHPSADCFKGAGFRVIPAAAKVDSTGKVWGCFTAVQRARQFSVCELIKTDSGQSWYDTSSWFWSAVMNSHSGPWMAYTVVD